jgi:hypothetical protein
VSALDKIIESGSLDRACPPPYKDSEGKAQPYIWSVGEIQAARSELAALRGENKALRVIGDRAMLWQNRNAGLVAKAALADEIYSDPAKWLTVTAIDAWLSRYEAVGNNNTTT